MVCSVERMSYNTNTLYLVMDQNAAGNDYDTMNVLTITGLQTPSDFFFRVEFGFKPSINHPRETFDYFVHHMGSAEGWPMYDNFASVGASGGVAYISNGATMVRANTTLVVVHQPTVTCRSTPVIPAG